MAPIIAVEAVSASYGKVHAVSSVSIAVEQGEVVALAGHNGAGKSTLLRAVMGAVMISSGRVCMSDRDITRMEISARVRSGLCLVPQNENTFRDMTIAENLDFSARIARTGAPRREKRLSDVYELFPVLWDKRLAKAGSLSGGQRQMLAIGIALVKDPVLLMLDEPSIGLAPVLVERLFDNIAEINRQRGTAVLVVEQNIHEAFRVAKRVYIMRSGSILLSGASASIRDREDLFTML